MSSIQDTSLYDVFRQAGIPIFYGSAPRGTQLPYLVYVGAGQDTYKADNTFYWRQDTFRLEYYFREKSGLMEAEIEVTLLDAGFRYEKSEDVYIEDEHVFVIYYYI